MIPFTFNLQLLTADFFLCRLPCETDIRGNYTIEKRKLTSCILLYNLIVFIFIVIKSINFILSNAL